MRAFPEYLPSPRKIASECEQIRQRWTPAERRRRTVGFDLLAEQERWFPPTIETASCLSGVGRVVAEV
ncbi:hypothetical protein [Bythopirellula goksoeyrii]|uniref:Uncharacterized protein n=1 Tax=Bythopirellula goksoeyrii TaxID=1400387 RepID=A0A5B9QG30_9BACT|nr:hypothetical protein [Bythopirellula goksoeyrii]QEG37978.1 hypothetical protein Pr1d_53260 [Bythopirellula goksoeyrii]